MSDETKTKPKRKTHTSPYVINRYIKRTYTRFTINLRNEEDAELISHFARRHSEGVCATDAVRELYRYAKRGED